MEGGIPSTVSSKFSPFHWIVQFVNMSTDKTKKNHKRYLSSLSSSSDDDSSVQSDPPACVSSTKSRKASSRSEKKPKKPKKPKKQPSKQLDLRDSMLKTSERKLDSLTKLHKGKRLLLKAEDIYTSIPKGEEKFLFQYRINKVNDGGTTATLQYEWKYIEEGGTKFKAYPIDDGLVDNLMENYRVALIPEDHDLYNKYLGISVREANDLKAASDKAKLASKISAREDVTDIDDKIINREICAFDVAIGEFQPVGDEMEHVVAKGKDMGKITTKQTWSEFIYAIMFYLYESFANTYEYCNYKEHIHSGHEFLWHIPPDKKAFDSSTLWKVMRKLVERGVSGSIRLHRILVLTKKDKPSRTDADSGAPVEKAARKDDMVRRVLAVIAGVTSKIPLSVFSNPDFRAYTESLDPTHKPPHHLEINRIIEVLVDAVVMEFLRIVKEQRESLNHAFISLATDFWTDSHRKASFGVLVMDLVANKFLMKDGRYFFMSKETAQRNKVRLASVSDIKLLIYYSSILIHDY